MDLPVLGDTGTAGLGAAFEQSLPIFDGGFNPDGLENVVGLDDSDLGNVDAAVLTVDVSEETDDGVVGFPTVSNSFLSLIFDSLLEDWIKL